MYIQSVNITNIRSIAQFEMRFDKPAGWHVVIGDNGSGKSSVVRSIAATLIGPDQVAAVLPVWNEWLTYGTDEGSIVLELSRDSDYDNISQTPPPKKTIQNQIKFKRKLDKVIFSSNANAKTMRPENYNWGNNQGWFSVAYGPFRRFTGGDNKWNKVYYSAPKAGAHLSVFGEDIALTEALDWLKDLDRKRLKEKEISQENNEQIPTESVSKSERVFRNLKDFINNTGLLPHDTYFEKVDVEGDLVFIDGSKHPIKIVQMSDGYRSILSLTFELIRQLVLVYDYSKVFNHIEMGEMKIDLPGVVLIDEIDAHLHPTWQTRIGQWFSQYFPNIQFIVTTHSPLICRACENGTIWRLSPPGSQLQSGEITGIEKKRLVFGNVLDAYGTEVFGQNVSISEHSNKKLNRLAELNMKSVRGKINDEEQEELMVLRQIFPTGVTK